MPFFSIPTSRNSFLKFFRFIDHKKQAAVNEIQRLKTEAAMKKPSQGFESHGVLSLSNLRLPLKPDFLAMLSKGGGESFCQVSRGLIIEMF